MGGDPLRGLAEGTKARGQLTRGDVLIDAAFEKRRILMRDRALCLKRWAQLKRTDADHPRHTCRRTKAHQKRHICACGATLEQR